MQGRNPIPGDYEDDLLLEYIRRVTLDAFWSLESSTVRSNAGSVRQTMKSEGTFGMGIMPPMGPFPLTDLYGV